MLRSLVGSEMCIRDRYVAMLWTNQLAVFLYQAPAFLRCTTLHLTLTAEWIWVPAAVEQTSHGYVSQSAEKKGKVSRVRIIPVRSRALDNCLARLRAPPLLFDEHQYRPNEHYCVGPTSSGLDEFKIKMSFLLDCYCLFKYNRGLSSQPFVLFLIGVSLRRRWN